MKTLTPYLFLAGECEAALQFYAEALGGRVRSLQRMKDAMPNVPPERASAIVHAEFEVDGALLFMASDGMPGPRPPGGNIALAVDLDGIEEQDRVWATLAEGGTIRHPLHDTFYGGRMGALTDRFGVDWMLSVVLKK